jgi:hypothetical protein
VNYCRHSRAGTPDWTSPGAGGGGWDGGGPGGRGRRPADHPPLPGGGGAGPAAEPSTPPALCKEKIFEDFEDFPTELGIRLRILPFSHKDVERTQIMLAK